MKHFTQKVALMLTLAFIAIGASAQLPVTGTYKIKNASTGKYVQLQGKYYAKPNAEASAASEVGVGVGYRTGDGTYKVYSLSGEYGGTDIEVYSYVAKATAKVYDLAYKKFVQLCEEYNGKTVDINGSSMTISADEDFINLTTPMIDSVLTCYSDAYAYATLELSNNSGDTLTTVGGTTDVYLKATIPSVPNSVEAAYQWYVKKHSESSYPANAWLWAKNKVKEYLNSKDNQTDATLKNAVLNNIDGIDCGTTYYLVAESDGTFGYSTSKSDAAKWTMELVEANQDNLISGQYSILNKGTNKYVKYVTSYDAAPSLSATNKQALAAAKANGSALFTVEFGKYDYRFPNEYQITSLKGTAEDGTEQDVVELIDLGMEKTWEIVSEVLDNNKDNEYLVKVMNKLGLTYDQVKEDVKTAFDIIDIRYANMKLVDNQDGTVSLYVFFPEVPEFCQEMFKALKDMEVWEWCKEKIYAWFEEHKDNQTAANLIKLVLEDKHLENVNPGNAYFLSADNDGEGTFAYVEVADETFCQTEGQHTFTLSDNEKWQLTEIVINGGDYAGYFRVKNAGTSKYVQVLSPSDAKPNYDIDHEAAGQVMRLDVAEGKVTTLRSQGVDVCNYISIATDSINAYSGAFIKAVFGSENASLQKLADKVIAGYKEECYLSVSPAWMTGYTAYAEDTTYVTLSAKLPAFDILADGVSDIVNGTDATDIDALNQLAKKHPAYFTFDSNNKVSGINEGAIWNYILNHLDLSAVSTTFDGYWQNNKSSLKPGMTYFLTADEDGTFGYIDATEVASAPTAAVWHLEEVGTESDNYFGVSVLTDPTVEKDGKYYATGYFDFPYTIQDGQAYTVTECNESGWLLVEAIGQNVPAQTPVMLEFNAGTDASGNKLLPSDEDFSISAKNILKSNSYTAPCVKNIGGNEVTYTINGANFFEAAKPDSLIGENGDTLHVRVLDVCGDDNVLGFWENIATTFPGNKAFVLVEKSVLSEGAFPEEEESEGDGDGVKGNAINFGGETAISSATTGESKYVVKDGKTYDMQGRQVARPTTGLYIINGQKVFIK